MNNQTESSLSPKNEHEKKRARKEPTLKLFMYIGTMSFVSLGYISREDLSGFYKLIALCFAVSTILSFISSIYIIRGLGEEEKDEENSEEITLRDKAMLYTVRSFALGVLGVTCDAVFG